MNKYRVYISLSWILPILAVYSVLPFYRHDTQFIHYLNNTAFWWAVNLAILGVLFISRKYSYNSIGQKDLYPLKGYLIYMVVQFIHGVFIAETYWDWKGLISTMLALLLPLAAYPAASPSIAQILLYKYLRYTIFLIAPIAFLIRSEGFGLYLAPVTLLIICLPVLTRKWKFIVLVLSVFVISIDLGARSNVLKFGIPFAILPIYYARAVIGVKLLRFVHRILFITPILLFILGASNIFNVFKMDEYIQGEYVEIKKNSDGKIVEESLTRDTRTFLYSEVLTTAKKYNSWISGRSPARGNETEWFADWAIENSGRAERQANEVAILNIFTWTGLIGVTLYALIFFRASFLAIEKSNNMLIKTIGIYMAFRWTYAWVEDINNFSLNYLMIWVFLGMCYSKSFRMMNDLQMKYWVRGIFDIRYTKRLKSYTRYLHQKKKTSEQRWKWFKHRNR